MALNVLGGNTPSIVNPIPWGIIPSVGPYSSQYQLTDEAYDYAIAGIPFLSGESLRGTYFRRMYVREFAPIRKDQFDNQQVPGEQSILGWWLRSQSNFSQGAGVQYLDTTVDSTLGQRFYYSEHIDALSIPGNIQLTQASKQILSSTSTNLKLRGVNIAGTDYVIVADGLVLHRIDSSGTSTNYTMPGGLSGSITSLTDDGVNYYFTDQSSGIYQGALSSTGVAATKIWNLPGSSTFHTIAFVKGRLVACLLNNVYELVGSGPNLPTPKFSHFNSSYRFSSIVSTPQSIMVSGFGTNGGSSYGNVSEIHKFTLDSSGALPVLSSGMVTASMPNGESINVMFSYLGAFVGIGTTKGLRIAQIDGNGNLVYGPLVYQNSSGVKAIAGYDRFLFAANTNNLAIPQQGFVNPSGASTTSSLIRVDLSQNTSTGSYPYCNDLDSHFQNDVLDVCNFGMSSASAGMMVISISGQGVFMTDTTKKESSGLFYTSRIRFNTLEDKHFKYLFLRTQPISDGAINVSAIDPSGGNTTVVSVSSGTTSVNAQATLIGTEGNQREWIQFSFQFTRGNSNNNVSPIMNGYQLRGLPGVNRQLLLTVPLSCHDFEEDKFGNPVGYDGSSNFRITALESLIASGNLVLFQDLNYSTANLVIIDDYRFEQQANEQPKAGTQGNADSNARGGYIILTARVVQ
jgi:hypothetical protein